MRFLTACFLAVNLLVFSACSLNKSGNSAPNVADKRSAPESKAEAIAQSPAESAQSASGRSQGQTSIHYKNASASNESLANADSAQSASQAIERKIIRNGKLIIETDTPTAGQQKITTIVESLGGFVITSDFKQGSASSSETVTITVRVPAPQFNEALEKIRKSGDRVINENVTGQDVTEEFLDLEARIKTKRALEAQFLEIMKQAKNVSDALEVQTEIANVRTEIERMEGRKRFLENQSSLSTITITLQTQAPIVTASTRSFSHSIKQAFGDGVDLALEIILGLIRLIIVLIPIGLFILLPLGFAARYAYRRLRANKKAEPVAQPQES